VSLTLMYLDFEVVFFLPIYTRKHPNTIKVWWSGDKANIIGPSQMKKCGGTVKIKFGGLDIFPNAKAPACNFFSEQPLTSFLA